MFAVYLLSDRMCKTELFVYLTVLSIKLAANVQCLDIYICGYNIFSLMLFKQQKGIRAIIRGHVKGKTVPYKGKKPRKRKKRQCKWGKRPIRGKSHLRGKKAT